MPSKRVVEQLSIVLRNGFSQLGVGPKLAKQPNPSYLRKRLKMLGHPMSPARI